LERDGKCSARGRCAISIRVTKYIPQTQNLLDLTVLTSLQKVVIPLKKGIHAFSTTLKDMDSRLRGNDAQALSRLYAVESVLADQALHKFKMLCNISFKNLDESLK
jgi:hypothetical protein